MDDKDFRPSRRDIVGGAAVGIASAGLTGAAAAQTAASGTAPAAGLVDPTTKYARPPFQSQSQPFPGLAGKMNQGGFNRSSQRFETGGVGWTSRSGVRANAPDRNYGLRDGRQLPIGKSVHCSGGM